MTDRPIIHVSGLSKTFGGVEAVRDVTFDVARAEMVALIGPNGAGKTTCFNILMGQLRPDNGSILFEGKNIVGMSSRKIWRLGIGRTFQITATYPSMTVIENVQMALISHHRRAFDFWSRARDLYRDEATELLSLVGMSEHVRRPAAVLAYGDLKCLELAIALANAPKLLLMDEPTAGMAPRERHAMMQRVADIVNDRAISVLFTEHDMDVVFARADRIMVMNRGRVIASGSPEAIRNDRTVREIYLGGGARVANAEKNRA